MNGRQMSRQTSVKQTIAQTQARQPNKQMVESAGRCSLSKLQKLSAATATTPKATSIFNLRISQEFNSFSLSMLSEISQTEYVRQRQIRKKNLKIGRRIVHILSNIQKVAISRCCFVIFFNQRQSTTHAYTATALVAVAVKVCLIKLSKTE